MHNRANLSWNFIDQNSPCIRRDEPVPASQVLHDRGADDGSAHYYGCTTEMDEQIGRLRAVLKHLGVGDNTLITFTSDNGPEGKESSREVSGL